MSMNGARVYNNFRLLDNRGSSVCTWLRLEKTLIYYDFDEHLLKTPVQTDYVSKTTFDTYFVRVEDLLYIPVFVKY